MASVNNIYERLKYNPHLEERMRKAYAIMSDTSLSKDKRVKQAAAALADPMLANRRTRWY